MQVDRRSALVAALGAGLAIGARAGATSIDPVETIDLWPQGALGMPTTPPVEAVDERSSDPGLSDRSIRGISRPRLVVFRPAVPNGSAVLVMPGGGYARVVIDKEGYELARWLTARGYTVFVLFYRLPGDGWRAGPDVALSDAQRSVRLIRARARDYGIQPERVAAVGFSAGGHVCGDLATRFAARTYAAVDAADRLSARPAAAAPIYAVQSMTPSLAHPGSRSLLLGSNPTRALERAHSTAANVSTGTPPCFLLHAEDDAVVDVGNTLEFRAACKAAGVPVETHLFAQGGHGFGLRLAQGRPVAVWPELFHAWARAQGLG